MSGTRGTLHDERLHLFFGDEVLYVRRVRCVRTTKEDATASPWHPICSCLWACFRPERSDGFGASSGVRTGQMARRRLRRWRRVRSGFGAAAGTGIRCVRRRTALRTEIFRPEGCSFLFRSLSSAGAFGDEAGDAGVTFFVGVQAVEKQRFVDRAVPAEQAVSHVPERGDALSSDSFFD